VKLTEVSIAEAVERAESLIRLQVSDAGLRFSSSCEPDVKATADPDRLQQILLNLLTNAIKFTLPGGEIAVTCERAADRVRIHVRDTGAGIAAENLTSIFAPFVQIDAQSPEAHRGVGLGLAISRDLAHAMNGEVTAESRVGEGSVFTVELPAA
jgi:signal transduction histidine kinase